MGLSLNTAIYSQPATRLFHNKQQDKERAEGQTPNVRRLAKDVAHSLPDGVWNTPRLFAEMNLSLNCDTLNQQHVFFTTENRTRNARKAELQMFAGSRKTLPTLSPMAYKIRRASLLR